MAFRNKILHSTNEKNRAPSVFHTITQRRYIKTAAFSRKPETEGTVNFLHTLHATQLI